MKSTGIYILVISLFVCTNVIYSKAQLTVDLSNVGINISGYKFELLNSPPIAVNLPQSAEGEIVIFFLYNIDAINIGCGIYIAKFQLNTFTHTQRLIINR